MCKQCTAYAAEIEQWAAVGEMEREQIRMEVAAGLSVPQATRPMFAHEVASEVRFADIAANEDAAADDAGQVLELLLVLVGGVVLSKIFGDKEEITPAELAVNMVALQAGQPDNIRAAIKAAVVKVQTVMASAYAGASRILGAEAARQGVAAAVVPELEVPAALYRTPATGAAMYPWNRVMGKVAADHLSPNSTFGDTITRESIQETIEGISPDGAKDQARQLINGATGDGRNDTAAALQPAQIWASELMDGVTCGPCSRVDGHEYDDIDEARTDYPHGTYKNCLGKYRCRGTLVFKFEE